MPGLEFAGEQFELAEKIGLMPLMRFAKVAQSGVDSGDMAGLAAMYDLLEQVIAPAEWDRFQAAADKSRADGEELMDVVKRAFTLISERPTSRPSVSSDGPVIVEPRSEDVSYLRVVKRLEDEGRPDQALMVLMANESSVA